MISLHLVALIHYPVIQLICKTFQNTKPGKINLFISKNNRPL